MKNSVEEHVRGTKKIKNIMIISLLIGSLIGTAVTLLFAPQSGRQTRTQIHQRSIQSRDRKQMDRLSAALEAGNLPVETA
jgi:gas vesicle protein